MSVAAVVANVPGVLNPEPAGPVNLRLAAVGKLSSDATSKSGAKALIEIGVAASVGVCAPPKAPPVAETLNVSHRSR